jgi:hypothetical protein
MPAWPREVPALQVSQLLCGVTAVVALVDVSRELVLLIGLALAPGGLHADFQPALVRPLDRLGFTEQSWLECLSHEGAGIGLAPTAARIFKTSAGRYYAPVPSEHAEILAMQADASIAQRCLVARAARLGGSITGSLARPATVSDVYLAHAIGIEPALRLLRAAEAAPSRLVTHVLPTEALRRPDLFFDHGRARTVGDVGRLLKLAMARASGGDAVRLSSNATRRRAASDVASMTWSASVTRAQ